VYSFAGYHPEFPVTLPSVSPQDLSDVIGQIYDCVLDPTGWQPVVARMQSLVRCMNAVLAVQALPTGRVLLAVTNGIDDAHLMSMADYGADILDQWGGLEVISRHPIDEPVVLSWDRPRKLWEHNRYYAEWAKPQGVDDVIGVIAARDATVFGTLGFARHIDEGPVTQVEVDFLRSIMPHVQRAVSISRALDISTIEAESFRSAFDAVPTGIVLVGSALDVLHANAAAQLMLSAGDPIAAQDGRLRVPFALSHRALADAVTLANSDEALIGRRGFGIPARTASGDAVVLHVLPLRRGSLRPGLNPEAAAAIFVTAETMPRPAPEQALAALFDLTPAEARVFASIGSGKTIAETAAGLGISRETVRTHLLHVFTKTGTNRQAELVELALSLSLVT
jgi:DNA-binding CsgD family transcriptional regulator/PAS domain-containing protein